MRVSWWVPIRLECGRMKREMRVDRTGRHCVIAGDGSPCKEPSPTVPFSVWRGGVYVACSAEHNVHSTAKFSFAAK